MVAYQRSTASLAHDSDVLDADALEEASYILLLCVEGDAHEEGRQPGWACGLLEA